ncbi:MAG: type II toxin-antitoxin system MqsR family toxin [Candidatus Muirbacterium halophilum]|nr:type II toxin-antitoxin system MqsR family toxin [Candidatus Muirbacterium halophilum]MCK9477214.1 type II toxin-antitoxin system MqsR family toxin [Candidatus Muirbacterium halophilum]
MVNRFVIIDRYLDEVASLIESNKCFLIEMEKNKKTILKLGFTKHNVFDEIKKLSYLNYISGPERDEDFNLKGLVWKFGKKINELEIYIKIKVVSKGLTCISFHEAEYKINYLFK